MGILDNNIIDNHIDEKNREEEERIQNLKRAEELHKYIATITDEFLEIVKTKNISTEEIEVYHENSIRIGLFDKKASYKKDKVKVWNIIKLRQEHFFNSPFIEKYTYVHINNDKILKKYFLHAGIPKSEYEDTNLYIDAEKNCYFEAHFSEIIKKGDPRLTGNNIKVMVKAKIDALYDWLLWIGKNNGKRDYKLEYWDNVKYVVKDYIEKRIGQLA